MSIDSLDNVGLDHDVLVDELGRVGIVGMNAPTLAAAKYTWSGLSVSKKARIAA